eukprot:TRINITY_DN4912_c0_g1_i1.p1 TRINITY_DN4912_c0_g1~~TRINITY_DN4912_c0_g1_i1.p1  ORF type:complete len:467 (+),score=85.52 TRINITY_DN4912_c0_g1_i1:239-1639(+)
MSLYRPASRISRGRDGPLFAPSPSELDLYNNHVEELLVESSSAEHSYDQPLLSELLDIAPVLNEAASAIVDDSFTRCFKSNTPEPWNWNLYLFPLWCIGVGVRYLILFPLRLLLLISGWILFLALFIPVHLILKPYDKLRRYLERALVEFMCSIFVASWTGVVKYHGPRPSRRPNQVFVANHTSMIDFIVLEQMTAFAVIMQKHPGWVGLLQTTILESVGCIWFNRTEAKDRHMVTEKIKKHVADPDANPLLIFPEGTCVNNEYTVMFKKGAFELGCAVCPVAIKYNKIFVDAFWNSRKQSFSNHLLRLMTSWAVVCDVWYLEPQTIREGESPIEFSERVREMIAKRAGIKMVPWDGYLKYYRPSPKLTEKKQAKYAESIAIRLQTTPGRAPAAAWPAAHGTEDDDVISSSPTADTPKRPVKGSWKDLASSSISTQTSLPKAESASSLNSGTTTVTESPDEGLKEE